MEKSCLSSLLIVRFISGTHSKDLSKILCFTFEVVWKFFFYIRPV
jgi:hypothetical protein